MQPLEQSISSLSALLACPLCKGPLKAMQAGGECQKCARFYVVEEGILRIASRSTQLGEFSNEDMQRFLRAAEGTGWKAALETQIKPKNRAVLDLILDPRRSSFLALLPPGDGRVAADVGCGYGGISLQLARSYRQVFALDSGSERLGFLNVIRRQEHIGNILPIHHEDITALPFADGAIDLLVMVGVFEYLPLSYPDLSVEEVQRRVLREVHRVLRPGGHLYLGTKNRYGWPYWKGAADHNRLRFGPVLPRRIANWLTWHLYNKPYRIVIDSYRSYRRLLTTSGFPAPRFYWPDPGYQFPDDFVPLGGGAQRIPETRPRPTALWKAPVLSTLRVTGMLSQLAPHFAIVARRG